MHSPTVQLNNGPLVTYPRSRSIHTMSELQPIEQIGLMAFRSGSSGFKSPATQL